jgi:hypothetical protein
MKYIVKNYVNWYFSDGNAPLPNVIGTTVGAYPLSTDDVSGYILLLSW